MESNILDPFYWKILGTIGFGFGLVSSFVRMKEGFLYVIASLVGGGWLIYCDILQRKELPTIGNLG